MSETAPLLDLRPDDWDIVCSVLRQHVPDREVLAFGSRATWTAKNYSDLDLAILGDEPLPLDVSSALAEAFSESDLPFKVDLVDWARIDKTFRRIIRRDGLTVQIPAAGCGAVDDDLRSLKSVDKWQVESLDECLAALIDYRGKSPPKSATGIPVLSAKVVKTTGLLRPIEQMIAPDYYPKWMTRGLPQPGDVVMTTEGPLGQVIQLDQETSKFALGQRIVCLRGKDQKLDNTFLRYLLNSPKQQESLVSYATGTTVLGISQKALRSMPISFPDFSEQERIGQVLASLDDKIDLNRRMNEILETIARAIFKDWFVDFGPTRVKAEDRTPYLTPKLWSLFPETFDEVDVPNGWRLSEIGKEVEVVGGSTPSTKVPTYWAEGKHHWATPKDLSKLDSPVLHDTDRKITDAGLANISSGLLPIGTVLLSSRAPVGYLAVAEIPTAVNQGFIAMVCKKQLSNLFVLFWCYENLDYIKGISGGSTFAEISKRVFRPVPVLVPSDHVLAAFESVVRPLFDGIAANMRESALLAQARDLLLPQLISGELRVTEANIGRHD